MRQVKFLDLKVQYPFVKQDILNDFQEIFNNGLFTNGPMVESFEKEFAKYNGIEHCVAVNSGTAALHIALLAVGVKSGDEVIVPVNTFIATAEAVSLCGATPVFIDVDPKTYTLDPGLIKNIITEKTKAIIPVHLYGQMANMEQIKDIASTYGLKIIEDACQAHGASRNGNKAGAIGDIGCFSFYPGKNLGSYGEGGACITNDSELEKTLRMLRDHGSEKKYHHDLIGYNYRMTEFQGVVLRTKLKFLDRWNNMRKTNAQEYNKRLFSVITPYVDENNDPVYHLYVVQAKDRDKVVQDLKNANIGFGIHYPIPLHLQPAYSGLGYKEGDFPVAEGLSKKILSLPMYPELQKADIAYVCEVLG